MSQSEKQPTEQTTGKYEICAVPAARLGDRGDIHRSYSPDLIAMAGRVRKPFHHQRQIWVCTSIRGGARARSGFEEFEAFRLTPSPRFVGVPTTYRDRTSTADAAEAARRDPFGFYDGMTVKRGSELFVLTGPPVFFVARTSPSRPGNEGPEPTQLTLF